MSYTKRYLETQYPYTEDDIIQHQIKMREYEDYEYFQKTNNMSKKNKKQKNSIPDTTLQELESEGLISKNIHLSDSIDMKEYHSKYKTNWWKKMKDETEKQQ
jgi:hypothetical protein